VNLKQDLKLLGMLQFFLGFVMIIPTTLAWKYGEGEVFHAFLVAILSIFLVSSITCMLTWKCKSTFMSINDGLFFVTFTWIISTGFACLPLYLSKVYPTYCDAYFEIMSGFTTTGATVLSSVEGTARSILFWRSMTNWLGGMGIVVLFVAFLPMLGVNGTILVNSELVGPTKNKLTPKIGQTAIILWGLYIGFSVLQALLLLADHLSLYDAVTITFSTMSTAGFSVKNASIGSYDKPYAEIIITLFMLIAGTNFSLYAYLFRGKIKRILKDGELHWYIGLFVLCTLICAMVLTRQHVYPSLAIALRYTSFQSASIMTTTGFTTADYQTWPTPCQMLLLLMFFTGGCAGSTGGGVKVIRVRALFTAGKNTIIRRLHPSAVITNKVGDSTYSDTTMMEIAGFVGMYILTGLAGAVILTFSGVDINTAVAGSFLCIGNIGIGFGKIGPSGNFAFFPEWAKWFLSFLMLAGRLELFTVLSLFTADFWRSSAATHRIHKHGKSLNP